MTLNNYMYAVTGKMTKPELNIRIRLLHDCDIYKAHFPGHPITPGFCQLKLVTELLEQNRDVRLRLSEVKTLKFLLPLSPVQTPRVRVIYTLINVSGGQLCTRGVISCERQVFTRFSIIYRILS